MNFPFYIAKRYAASASKRKNIINIISIVSVTAIAVVAAAMVILLSIFNGMEDLVVSMLNTFDTPLKIESVEGKHFPANPTIIARLENIPGVLHVVESIEENALAEYDGRQHVIRVKGVGSGYQDFSPLDSMIIDGRFLLEHGDLDHAVLGAGVWYYLGVNIRDYLNQLTLIAPQRTSKSALNASTFNRMNIIPSGVFSVQQELDEKYIIVPLRFAQELFDYDSLRSYYEIWTVDDKTAARVKQQVMEIVGPEFRVSDRFEQQIDVYKMMRSEKWVIYLILSFVVVLAAFNMISSLAMLILDKQKDMFILGAMGTPIKRIRAIFLWQGLLQSFIGAVAGILLGLLLCFLQTTLGVIPLDTGGGTFIVDYYPVTVRFADIPLVFVTILLIGSLTSLIPVSRINDSFLINKT